MIIGARLTFQFDVNEALFKQDPQRALQEAAKEGKAVYTGANDYLPESWNEGLIDGDIEFSLNSPFKLKPSEIGFIVYTGYYLKHDDEDILHPHTQETWDLYEKGLAACGRLTDEEIYDGICFDINDKPLAQINTGERYIPVVAE